MNPPPGRSSASTEWPALRKATANVLTDLGWSFGTFNLPPHQSLADFLAPGTQVVKLANSWSQLRVLEHSASGPRG